MRIVRADGSVVEGTPAEIAEFEALRLFSIPAKSNSQSPSRGEKATDPAGEVPEDWEYVSTDLAFRALTRLKLSRQQKTTIRLIYAGGEKWTSAADIQKKIGYTPSQFAGLMGAFGRRVVNTPGYVLHSAFFEQEWDETRSCYIYRLPPSVRAAVERARVLD